MNRIMNTVVVVRFIAAGCLLAACAGAHADVIATSAAGKGIDTSNPLDGIAEAVTPSTSTIDLQLNAVGSSPREDRGIMEFDLSSITGGVLSAFLEFETYGPSAVGQVNVYSYSGNGLLELVDFGEISTLAAQPVLGSAGVYSIDVTSAVQAQLNLSSGFAGFVIAIAQEDKVMSIWNVGEVGHLDPGLNITVPGPASALVIGLFGVARSRRRRI